MRHPAHQILWPWLGGSASLSKESVGATSHSGSGDGRSNGPGLSVFRTSAAANGGGVTRGDGSLPLVASGGCQWGFTGREGVVKTTRLAEIVVQGARRPPGIPGLWPGSTGIGGRARIRIVSAEPGAMLRGRAAC
jgi:hypothetical protein